MPNNKAQAEALLHPHVKRAVAKRSYGSVEESFVGYWAAVEVVNAGLNEVERLNGIIDKAAAGLDALPNSMYVEDLRRILTRTTA